jgi:hypothetical protein
VGAVLTVLASVPPANSFRPPYAGSAKPIHSAASLRTDLLPSLAPPPNTPVLADVEKSFEKPWLDHVLEWQGDDLHPRLNLPNYGAGIARDNGTGALSLLLNYSLTQKQTLLYRFIQLGIDNYGLVKNGANWGNVGGTIGPGRKMPILFAGLILDNADMKNVAKDYNTRQVFQEDGQTFYLTQAERDATRHPDNCSGSADYCHPGYYDSTPLGTACWGERYYRWLTTGYNYLPGKVGYHRITHKSTTGTAVVIHVLGLKTLWNHNAYLDWMDRCVAEKVTGTWGSYFADFMWAWYRDYQVGIDNFKYQISNSKLQICPTLPNPVTIKEINDLRLTINDIRFFNLTGKFVLNQQQVEPGIYYIEYNNQVSKLVVVE